MIQSCDDHKQSPIERLRRLAKDCYQCGKCSAGCPVAETMDMLPHQLLRLVQLGQAERAVASPSPWVCVSCQTCAVRCPQNVDGIEFMDLLRQHAVATNRVAESQRATLLFQQAFLENIRRHGRLHELQLIGTYKMRVFARNRQARQLFAGATLAPRLMRRGKFRWKGESVQDQEVVQRIVDRCLADNSGLEVE